MNRKYSQVFLVAMQDEIERIFDLSEYKKNEEFGFISYHDSNKKNVIVRTGIGKSNAAAAAQYALQTYDADQYINTGLVGAFDESLQLSEVVQVNTCRFFDVDVTAFKYKLGQIPKCEKVSYELEILNSRTPYSKVSLVSGDTFLNDEEYRKYVVQELSPQVVDMELASIAHIFHIHNKLGKLYSIKALSDYANSSSTIDFYELMDNACKNLKKYFNHA